MPMHRHGLFSVGLAALLAGGGCTTPAAQEQSLYLRLGGDAAIVAMVADAIGNISADTRINRRFANAQGPSLQRNLVDLVCERTGGPCRYRGLDMAAAHEGMHISDEEFDALLEDMGRSFDRFKLPARERAEALAILRRMKNAVVGH